MLALAPHSMSETSLLKVHSVTGVCVRVSYFELNLDVCSFRLLNHFWLFVYIRLMLKTTPRDSWSMTYMDHALRGMCWQSETVQCRWRGLMLCFMCPEIKVCRETITDWGIQTADELRVPYYEKHIFRFTSCPYVTTGVLCIGQPPLHKTLLTLSLKIDLRR